MTSWKFLAVLGFLAFVAAGCRQTKTVIAEGAIVQSVQLIGVPKALTVVQQTGERDPEGNLKRVQAQIRNQSNSEKAWSLEYQVQFFNAAGLEVPSMAKGWVPLTIGRGELASLNGATILPGAVRATVAVREHDPKE
jgi:uncharacterized protein YcfL